MIRGETTVEVPLLELDAVTVSYRLPSQAYASPYFFFI